MLRPSTDGLHHLYYSMSKNIDILQLHGTNEGTMAQRFTKIKYCFNLNRKDTFDETL